MRAATVAVVRPRSGRAGRYGRCGPPEVRHRGTSGPLQSLWPLEVRTSGPLLSLWPARGPDEGAATVAGARPRFVTERASRLLIQSYIKLLQKHHSRRKNSSFGIRLWYE